MDAKKLEQELDALVDDLERSSGLRDQGIIDNLRICIKYLVFDLEATQRENEELRKQLKGEQ